MTELNWDENETTLIIMNDEGLYLRYKELYEAGDDTLNAFMEELENDINYLGDVDSDNISLSSVAMDLIEMYEAE